MAKNLKNTENMSNIVEGKRVKEMSIEELSSVIDRKEINPEKEDIEDEILTETILKNVRGFVYFESKPIQLEKFKFSKVGYALIMEFSPDIDLDEKEYEKTKSVIMKECKNVCDKRAKQMYEEYNEGRTEF